MDLYPQQQTAQNKIKRFLQNKSQSVFILKGSAGTGKTTMIAAIIHEIEAMGLNVVLMAPTGRTAKILIERTGHEAKTIHREIYAYDKMGVDLHDEHGNIVTTSHNMRRSKGSDDVQFWFQIRQSTYDPSECIFIIDEASMISSKPQKGEMLHFGTDVLIDDIMTYVRPHLGGRIIFIGDPAQLPPVGDNHSVALDESYFTDRNLCVSSYELTEIVRQSNDSAILTNATRIRNLQKEEIRNELCFERRDGEVEDITPEDIIKHMYAENPVPIAGSSIVICDTNASAYEYNKKMRSLYFPEVDCVCAGDVLIVAKNSYCPTNDCAILLNGTFVKVLEVSSEVERLAAPVWTDDNGGKKRVTVELRFRDALIQSASEGKCIRCKLLDNFLDSRVGQLSHLYTTALYINFCMRHPDLDKHSEVFKAALMADPYYNAVHVKYGYAITAHKAQGGEWDTVYVDYSGKTGLKLDSLRWMYTATTRAKKRLFGVNMPNITPLSEIVVCNIREIAKPHKDAFSFADVGELRALPAGARAFQKQKYLSVDFQLNEAGFYLKEIRCFPYQDKYYIETPSGSVAVDCYYSNAGFYTKYVPSIGSPDNDKILTLFNNDTEPVFDIKYAPSSNMFIALYGKMQSICCDCGVQITNVVEYSKQYYVTYYLKTSGKFSLIQFYFNGNQRLTSALPSSDLGSDDLLLVQLLENIKHW